MEMLSKSSFEEMLAELEEQYCEDAASQYEMLPQLSEEDLEGDDFLPETCPACGWDVSPITDCSCMYGDPIIAC